VSNNTKNLDPISHRFPLIAHYRSTYRLAECNAIVFRRP